MVGVESVIEQSFAVRPGDFCRFLLGTLDAADAQTRRRKRDQTPDRIGLGLRRELLEQVIQEDPDTGLFENWFMEKVLTSPAPGPLRATAALILDEYRFAATQPEFTAWLLSGAPSADSEEESHGKPDAGVIDGERRRKGGFHSDEHWCPICSSDHVRDG